MSETPRSNEMPTPYTRRGGRHDLPAPLPSEMLGAAVVEITDVVDTVLNEVGPPPGWTGITQEGVN